MRLFLDEIEQATPAGIAAALGRLISSGRLAPGERLPTVRDLAGLLGVSPATVSHAWQALSSAGLIVSRGRSGTFVREQATRWLPARTQSLAGHVSDARIDLSRGTPDPLLLPALGPALSRVSQRAMTPSYQALPVIPELLTVLAGSWPYRCESITVVDGALDAVSRSLEQVARFGDRVIVEDPGFPPFFDLLDQMGIERLPVAVDAEGIVPAAFQAALSLSPAAVILQPRAHNPTGASMTADRAAELARLLAASPRAGQTVVIEDDHSGAISTSPDVSLGKWLPERVLHVRSYSKSHGPDLRIAALGGPAALVDRIVARRMLGPGWTSRMLQTILHELLTDGASMAQVNEGGCPHRVRSAPRPRRRHQRVGAGGRRTRRHRAARGVGHPRGRWQPVSRIGAAGGVHPRDRRGADGRRGGGCPRDRGGGWGLTGVSDGGLRGHRSQKRTSCAIQSLHSHFFLISGCGLRGRGRQGRGACWA
ncbi:aminotransferase class I/II-fold pyridoxal phosphate-dependent enzyme [Cryobacterium sp. W22_MBD10_FK3]|uniref:aminotransferase class I/II-fold pyridoxal phosphate-dependent enzyme n=1 Tax=Cryobacterium sp. W22_MBD10_FK3 TaxID=3240273 RepID=UPI003F938405